MEPGLSRFARCVVDEASTESKESWQKDGRNYFFFYLNTYDILPTDLRKKCLSLCITSRRVLVDPHHCSDLISIAHLTMSDSYLLS